MKIFNRIIDYFKEARVEMKKVNWLTRKEVIKYTLIVVGLSFVVAIFLGGLDFLFTFLISKFLL
ncbi:MAG: preprotein translocase subunit SecE [Candidatus Portnoybacteria bacterium RBG_13_40_8]|uniref:Protein translocase subunit SecE n=1 Tax=Candidatus Portnoybacteria bacterium RBG_13_40_8 TaxID=1801990 RepID=A0A1G2F1H0_9BACT|nr:MAG: preprotein translocase subunit SecE [Candidatus Portnoybacteria bacterium RBG_13_40_8]OGZ36031.1 MAG: preprotein translocase subunit SecE [Candidatus Portnoybacteria bacterium RIFCSPHIGHO2_01_FULL_39_19]